MKNTKKSPVKSDPVKTEPKKKSFWRTLFVFSPKGTKKRWLKNILRVLLYLAIAILVAMIAAFLYFSKDLPDPGNINKRNVPQSTRIMDRNGEVLYEVHGDENRTVIDIETLPNHVKMASVAIEDDAFYKHPGFDVKGIARAVMVDVIGGTPSQGGSTITQQFVKNSILTSEKRLTRKAKELILAVELEWMYSKDEILEMYLNEIPYGSSAYGIEAAANTFFGKSAKSLSIAEAATLASLPNAPSYYSPYGNHPEDLLARRNKTLNRMAEQGYITPEELDESISM